MKSLKVLTLSSALVLAALPLAASDIDGAWKGAIHLPQGELGIAVELACGGEDGASGTIDIPAQGLRDFALSNVRCDGTRVHFEMAGVPGVPTFDGELDAPGEIISGAFRQGPQELTFSLSRGGGGEEPPESPSDPVPGEGLVGDWLGKLSTGPLVLRLALTVARNEDGSYVATFDSVDQGAEIPVEELTFVDGEVSISLPAVQGSYTGRMNADGSAIEGEWRQAGRVLPLIFERQAEPFEIARPQEPRPPFPYQSRDVVFHNEAGEIDLGGTVVVPEGEGPFPAVVFVSGSGAQDRDEQLMGHKPFLVIADHLARKGIASLRFDDRGFGQSGGDHFGSTIADFATDVEAALGFLRSQSGIDPDRVGILGHSEGGVTGPLVAARSDDVAFVVTLAPPGVPLVELLLRQTADSLRLTGVEEELIERLAEHQAQELELIRDETLTDEALEETLRERVEAREEYYTPEELAALGFDEANLDQAIGISTSAWFRSLMRVDPATYWSRIDVPVLALFGAKDVQVAAEENASALGQALETGGNNDFEVHVLPQLNHLFQHAETGSVAEYASIEETISPEVLEMMADWIRLRTRS